MTSNLNIPALQEFAKAIDKDSNLIFSPELAFLRTSLSNYFDIKHVEDIHQDHIHAEEHVHDESCHHDHSHHENHLNSDHDHSHSHDKKAEEEEEIVEEPEEEDPDQIPAEEEPILQVPTGGEGNCRT